MQISNFTLVNSSTNFPVASAVFVSSDLQNRIVYISDDGNDVIWTAMEQAGTFGQTKTTTWVWNRQNETHTLVPLLSGFAITFTNGSADFITTVGVLTGTLDVGTMLLTGTIAAAVYNRNTGEISLVPGITATTEDSCYIPRFDYQSDSTGRYFAYVNQWIDFGTKLSKWTIYDNVGKRTLSTSITANGVAVQLLTNYFVDLNEPSDYADNKVYDLSGNYLRTLEDTSFISDSQSDWIVNNGNYMGFVVNDYYGIGVWDASTGEKMWTFTIPNTAVDGIGIWSIDSISSDGKKFLYEISGGAGGPYSVYRYDSTLGLNTNLTNTLSADGMFITVDDYYQGLGGTPCSNNFNYYGFTRNELTQMGLVSYNGIWPLLTYLRKRLLGYF